VKALFGLLKNRWLWLLIALLLIALVIFAGGPYFSFADYTPLQSRLARTILFALVVVFWFLKRALREIKAAVAGRRLVQQVARQEDPSSARASADAAKLQQRFAEATAALQKSRKDRTSLYDLPWYIIIGPPGAGKTTALANSGLRFPLARDGKDAKLAGVGGTRNCDWWFTDQAILLDTAGRYTTQDSDQASDAAGWREFLALLRRYRGRRPINGVLLALSVADLLGQSDAARSAHVAAIRSRLEELSRELRISLPVYVVLTKCDLLAGFSEFFDDLTPEGRAQVWGTTFPIDASRSGAAAEQLPSAFQQLLERLGDRMFLRMDAERDVQRRALIFGFPQQVAGVRRPLLSLVGELFGGGTATQGIWLRGVYFTSGTQEGTPVDRMLGALARTFGLSVKAVDTQNVRGRAYFIQRLLTQVVFQESGLAGVNKSVEARHAAVQAATYGGIAVAALLMMAWMITSYGRNRAYLNETQKAVQPLASLPPPAGADLGTRLARLDAYREVLGATDLGGNYRALLGPTDSKGNGVPFLMRAGLYQGNAVSGAAAEAYLQELNADLTPAMAGAFHERLAALGGDPDNLYRYLKAYLMLGEPDRLVAAEMQSVSDQEWRLRFANDAPTVERLDAHVAALLADKSRVRPVTLDDDLVARARTSLKQASLPVLMYSRLKLRYAGDTAGQIHLDKEIGVGGDSLLVHRNGTPLSEPIPAIYTRAVFQEVATTGKLSIANDFIHDSWVLGEGVASVGDIPRLTGDLMGVYEDDYIRAWDRVLGDLGPRPRRSPQDLSDMMALLASPTSPLKRLLVVVDDNTNLTKPRNGPGDKVNTIKASVAATVESVGQTLSGGAPSAPPGTKVTQHFAALHKLIEAPPGGTPPIDDTMRAIGEIQKQLAAAGSAVGQGSVLTQVATPAQAAAAAQLRVAAKELPQPISGIVAQIGSASQAETIGQASQELARRYESEVGVECRQLIGNRYPFGSGPGEVALADFARMFAPGGVYEKFFNDHLAQLVDNTREPWRWKEGAVGIGSTAMLARFQTVDRIRQVFFPPGAQLPTVRFTATPDSLDAAVRRLAVDIDGQSVEYRHGPTRAQPLTWPGPAPGQASVLFEETNGTGPNRAYKGPWAFFHLLEDASVQPQSDVRYAVTVSAGARSARVMLEASSVRNPFGHNELRGFRCSG
jgi:type VI secretion system protein ImpL